MKYFAHSLVFSLLFASPHLLAQSTSSTSEALDNKTRAETVKWLEVYKTRISGDKNKKISAAQLALSSAAGSESAAFNLYKMAKKEADFKKRAKNDIEANALAIEWERSQRDVFSQPGFKKAIQLQCAWILMGMKVALAENKAQSVDPRQDVLNILGSIASSPEIAQRKDAFQAAGIIKQALYINDLKPKEWVDSPLDIGGVFDRIILPKHAERKDLNGFRSMWSRRIDLERTLIIEPRQREELEKELKSSKNDRNSGRGGRNNDKRKATTSGISGARAGTDIKETGSDLNLDHKRIRNERASEILTDLRWRMEVACFSIGDERRAVANLKDILNATKDPVLIEQRVQSLSDLLDGKHKAVTETLPIMREGSTANSTNTPPPISPAAAAAKAKAEAAEADAFSSLFSDADSTPATPSTPADSSVDSEPASESDSSDDSSDDWDI